MNLRDPLARRIRELAYREGDFTLSSGRKSGYLIDKYQFETAPEVLREVARRLAERLPEGIERLAGMELGAVPLVTAVALETGLPFLIVRHQAKAYGTEAQVEGTWSQGERVALLEDVVTTGAQLHRAAEGLRELGLEVGAVIAVVDRGEGGAEALGEAGFTFTPLFTKADLGITLT
jgi:orotate phosphoribosyltransferase